MYRATAALVALCLFGLAYGQTRPTESSSTSPPASQPSADPLGMLRDKIEHFSCPGPYDKGPSHIPELLRELSRLSDEQLNDFADQTPASRSRRDGGFDLLLTEMIRRGGAKWEENLKRRLEPRQRDPDLDKSWQDLCVLTALRRVQKKEDPLHILVEGKSELQTTIGYLPEIRVLLTNLDPEKTTVSLWMGGDYRGASRHNKWRLNLKDSNGKSLPERYEPDMGGFMHPTTLKYAESVPLKLEIGSYVSIEEPGEYTFNVLFHPEISIGMCSDVRGLVCCQSIPIKLTVDPMTIESTPEEQKSAAALIAKLPAEGPVRILGGSIPDHEDDNFLPKDSPAGQLKRMGWRAVPELIKAADNDKLNGTQRAWALGLLFGITALHDPTQNPDLLGPFEYRHTGWVSAGAGHPENGVSVSRSSMTVPGGRIDEKAQREFASGWKPWVEKGHVKIVPPKQEQ